MSCSNHVIPRPEHPRPDFVRDTFCNLNGQWQFAFDDSDVGLQEINGLLTPDRKPKMDVDRLRQLNRNPDWHGDRDLKDAIASAW